MIPTLREIAIMNGELPAQRIAPYPELQMIYTDYDENTYKIHLPGCPGIKRDYARAGRPKRTEAEPFIHLLWAFTRKDAIVQVWQESIKLAWAEEERRASRNGNKRNRSEINRSEPGPRGWRIDHTDPDYPGYWLVPTKKWLKEHGYIRHTKFCHTCIPPDEITLRDGWSDHKRDYIQYEQ